MTGKIFLKRSSTKTEVSDQHNVLQQLHILALKAWGFKTGRSGQSYYIENTSQDLLMSVFEYLEKMGYDVISDENTLPELEKIKNDKDMFKVAEQVGKKIKADKSPPPISPPNFVSKIQIKSYQLQSIHHMIKTMHAANFSVPGSGKTLMTYATFDMLKESDTVESMLVIGPIASFGPWEHEYEFCFSKNPSNHILRYHGNNRTSHIRDIRNYDVVITSYDTASNDLRWLRDHLLKKRKVMMVIDESHHIKSMSDDAKHSNAMIELGQYAERRYILSGTPVPHSFADLWPQITFLWPTIKILFSRERYKKMLDNYGVINMISERIDFLWTRVTNGHLHEDMPVVLPYQEISVKMSAAQEEIYAAIERDVWKTNNNDNDGMTLDLFKYRKNRVMRMLQCVSNPHTMLHRDDIYNLDKFESNDLYTKTNLDSYSEIPPKIKEAARRALDVTNNNENVVIWTVFVKNVEMLCKEIKRMDPTANPIGISGDVPNSPSAKSEIEGRENLIAKFKRSTKGILVATMGSIAESISLHKTCRNAIYFERNFNAGQYMQSMSRIYRIGSDKDKPVQFTFLKSIFPDGKTDTIDDRIETVLRERVDQMHNLLNDESKLSPLELETTSSDDSSWDEDEDLTMLNDIDNMIKRHVSEGKI